MDKFLGLHGRAVPIQDFETLSRLEKLAFGLTPSTMPDGQAHRIATQAAIEGLDAMRRAVKRLS